jgi:RimJ/RimL family protein N-acetyltransferase
MHGCRAIGGRLNRSLKLTSRHEPPVILRAAAPADLEDLREWKNANKAGFFFQDEITEQMQKDWYAKYLNRPDDFMFIVEQEGLKVGCMGFRLEGSGAIDTYNIIASPAGAGKGIMKRAMAVLCSYAADFYTKDIGCLVLKSNTAVGYYQSCGFNITGRGDKHHIFKLDWTRFRSVAYDVSEKK